MAIAQMTKVMIASYRSEAGELLEKLQRGGIIQILDAERAMVSKEWPELHVDITRPREMEELVARLSVAITMLKLYATEKDETSMFNPLLSVERGTYKSVVEGDEAMKLLETTEQVESDISACNLETENAGILLEKLKPWMSMDGTIEELQGLEQASCIIGLVPVQHLEAVTKELAEMGAAIEVVGGGSMLKACIVACMSESSTDVQKKLRAADFEAVSFEGISGSIKDNISKANESIKATQDKLTALKAKAGELAKDRIKLQILFDHYQNMLGREKTQHSAPATDNVVLFEGWAKEKDYSKLEKIVSKFEASSISKMETAEGEETPVEIDNGRLAQPFETVTRLYGMPNPKDVDPTAFLAPFFALFFGICLTDAAYGLVMIAFLWWMLKKIKGDKKFITMLIFCSITTVVAGALTGGWCGDAIQIFAPGLSGFRESLMWFDPMEEPMTFFYLSLGLGYLQIISGIFIGFIHKLRRGDITEALFDHGTWFVWLNSLGIAGLAKAGVLHAVLGPIFGIIAIIPAIGIILFSEREGGWGARIGMGIYNVFSTVFYVGDVLSYIRLMALGMVTAGFGMAINQIVVTVMETGSFGWVLGALIFVGGHLFNIANSALGSFVHSMRLQFVEFFTKFIVGGGKEFEPLREKYQHIEVKEEVRESGIGDADFI